MKTNLVPFARARSHGSPSSSRFHVRLADARDRDVVYRLRHEVYARELGQHGSNDAGRLRDQLDAWNIYLVARVEGEIAGFISVTPPGQPAYSIDKYFERGALPFTVDDGLHEIRLLTVLKPHRGCELAPLLMYTAFRWVEAHGGRHVVAIGRREVVDLYQRVGMKSAGLSTQSGRVSYELLHASLAELRQGLPQLGGVLTRLEEKTEWALNFPFRQPASCFHGGAFFTAIGDRFDSLERSRIIINADVLDAWFPPAPGVTSVLREHLPWLLRTSPPTGCEGLLEAIAAARGVTARNILPGAGSSDLIFRALRHWLTPASHALILDPTYGEYAHVLEGVIGCTVDRLPLSRPSGYAVPLDRLEAALEDGYDLVVLVNPNSPTGRHVPRTDLERVLRRAPAHTRVWVDETYMEYAGARESLEAFAAISENIVVCKSMSKVYALSGARVAYLCAGPHQLEALCAITPPWVVGLPSQVAAVQALQDPGYYATRYAETAVLREALAGELTEFGWDVNPGIANFLLCHLPETGPDAATIVRCCREHGLFLRDARAMGLGCRAIRVAVKDTETNARMIAILAAVLGRRR